MRSTTSHILSASFSSRAFRSVASGSGTGEGALLEDLRRAASAQGADAISDITQRQINGLMANCWYVVEASANTWIRR